MAYPEVVRLEQLRSASAIAAQLMSQRGDSPEEAATSAIEAVSVITSRIFDDESLHIAELEDIYDDSDGFKSTEFDEDEDEDDFTEEVDLDTVDFAGKTLSEIEFALIRDTLMAVNGDTKAAAEMLDITPQVLGKKMKKLEEELEELGTGVASA